MSDDPKKTPLCYMPWHALTITGQGDIKPCCQSTLSFGNLHSGEKISQLPQNPEFQKLREDLLNGRKPSSCSSCWDREAGINESRRTWFVKKFMKGVAPQNYKQDSPLDFHQLDVNFSNRCNLRCRMCGSWGSHRWIEEDSHLSNLDRRFKREGRAEKLVLREITTEQVKEVLPLMKNIQRIDFKGGEPMLPRAHLEFLELLCEEGFAENIELVYTTNGTVYNEQILRRFPNFKKIMISVSIEATGPLYQYIRGGQFDLETVTKNILRFSSFENVTVAFNVATQVYNVLRLRELWTFIKSLEAPRISPKDCFKYTMVNSPAYLSPYNLPPELAKMAHEKIADIEELSHIADGLRRVQSVNENWPIFCSFTDELDKSRSESIFKVLPEMQPHWSPLNDLGKKWKSPAV